MHKNTKYPIPDTFVEEFNADPNITIKHFENKYGVNTLTVKRWAKEANITFRKSNQSLEEQFGIEWIKNKVLECNNPNDANLLCKQLGIRKTRLESFCKRHKIDMSTIKGKSLVIAPDKKTLEDMISKGMTNQQIEKHFGVTNPVLKRWYRELGIERKPYDGTVTDMPTYEVLYNLHVTEQKNIHLIASLLNTSFIKVKSWLNEYKIPINLYRSKRTKWPSPEELKEMNEQMPFCKIAEVFGVSDVQISNIAKEYGISPKEHGIGQTSEQELKILDFVHQYYPSASKISLEDISGINFKKPTVSYDICIPEIQLIIEYDGIYFHSEQYQNNNRRHYDKMFLARSHGYSIINIFSDEWKYKEDIVKSIILHKIGKTPNKIYARNTTIKQISTKEANLFYDQNHIQGKSNNFIVSYGLFCGELIVAAMSFGRHHRKNDDSIVLRRFAVLLNHNVVGGASKLFKFAIKYNNWNRVVSWSDNRWSDGALYKTLGFRFSNNVDIGYTYVYPNEIRKSAQSHTKKLIACPPEISERDFLRQKGIYRIWDCGKIKWEWKRGAN